ncbi:MAG TPA: exodeoxyribonuclease VII small subunit, partial [Gammaproteobacteria bacterium]|nr:exodeoxyribonuclease VII small subunit [Gammaproteobacteria bacterium]
QLARNCQTALNDAQMRVEKLIEDNGQLNFEEFDNPEEE